eukprot:1395171-Amorphochlora_amoeboformis.AAC.2
MVCKLVNDGWELLSPSRDGGMGSKGLGRVLWELASFGLIRLRLAGREESAMECDRLPCMAWRTLRRRRNEISA